jgi:VWFA-related protein
MANLSLSEPAFSIMDTLRSTRALLVFCLTVSIVSPTSAVAQTATASSDSSTPTLKVNTRLTLVDVTVTDSKGQPVHGLTRADFTVKEDGKPQPIKNFEAFGSGSPISESAPPPLPPNVYTNRSDLAPTTQAVNILLFDQVATGITRGLQPSPEALNLAKSAALSYLKTMPADTQAAILAMDGSGLHMVQGFTSDPMLLLAAVNSIAYQLVPQSYVYPPTGKILVCNAANYQSAQTLNGLNQATAFVSSIPGRKNLLWFTPGIPWLTYYAPFSGIDCLSDFTPQLQQIYGRLTAARVALYPIDPRGLYNEPAFSAGTPGSPGMIVPGYSTRIDTESLEAFAKATGGKAYSNRNDLDVAMHDAIATGGDYYALSYVPPLSKYDGKYHTIKVTVDRPGLQLQYRQGYTSLDINGPLLETEKIHGGPASPKDAFQTAMSYGAPTATQVEFAVRALPSTTPRKPADPPVIGSPNPELKGKALVRYTFAFDIPRDKITLVEQPDGTRKASFELALVAYDVQGRVLNSLDEKRSFVLKRDAVSGFLHRPFLVPVEIDLPPGNVSVRAGMLDLPSQQMGGMDIPLKVAAP